jgi:serine/threonine-protein kinase HipA
VTTSAYLAKDGLSLTLNGSTGWPTAKELRRLGETRVGGSPAKIRQMLERIADAVEDTAIELRAYVKEHAEFAQVGGRMVQEWSVGCETSLRG